MPGGGGQHHADSVDPGGGHPQGEAESHQQKSFLPHGQHLGILLVELGVGITVAAVLISIFFAFAGRERVS